MALKFDKNLDSLVYDLVNEKVDLNDLNLMKENHRTAFLQALEHRPRLINNVNEKNREKFISFAIQKDYRLFTYLKREFYTEELAQAFLYARLLNGNETGQKRAVSLVGKENVNQDNYIIQKSFDDKVLFIFNYMTLENDELYYFDHDLGVPSSLKSQFQISFKIVNAIKIIESIDVHIAQLGVEKIYNKFSDLICSSYKEFLYDYIEENEIGFYKINASVPKIQEALKEKFEEIFDDHGVQLTNFIIKSLGMPKAIQNKIEDQAFLDNKMRTNFLRDNEFVKLSLDNYERKLSIEQKYNDVEHSLTEYEKDLALERYLLKEGKLTEPTIDRKISLSAKNEKLDTSIMQIDDMIPEKQYVNKFKRGYFALLILSIIVALACLGEGGGVTLLLLAVISVGFGLIGAFMHKKFDKPKLGEEGGDDNGTNK